MSQAPYMPLILKVGWQITRNQVDSGDRWLDLDIVKGETFKVTREYDQLVSLLCVTANIGEFGAPKDLLTTQYWDMD